LDGRFISVGPLEPKFWTALNAALGRTGDASELHADGADAARLRADLASRFAARTRDEWEERFAGAEACVEPVLTQDELAAHPQHVARELFFAIDDERHLRLPLGGRAAHHHAAPTLGQDSATILAEAGLGDSEIAALKAAGVTR
jgi:alpha-methylacyl-CoA racemase